MVSFQEFKANYYVLNKDELKGSEPGLQFDTMLKAYEKYRDKSRCSEYYEENKEQINRRHKEYYENKKSV